MDLKAHEKRRVRELYRRTIRNLNSEDAMQNVRDVDLLPTKSPFASGSTATTYWTLWTVTITGI